MTESPLVAPHDTDRARGPEWARRGAPPGWLPGWRWALRLAVLLPIVFAVARALANDWFPVGDNALLTIRAADVGTRHHPLLGSWTSASLALGTDVNNPGPLYSDLVAPFMWTFGKLWSYGAGVAIGVGAVNAAATLGAVLVSARIGGWRAERWVLLLVAALTWSMGSELLFDIWQPHALLLPFTLLVVLTVGIAVDDLRLLPLWLVVLSVVVQTHVGYVYAGAALSAVVLVAVVSRIRSDALTLRQTVTSRSARWTGAVAAVAWVQPLWEQLFGAGAGNLGRLATSAGGGELTVGAGTAARLVAAVTVAPPWWTRFGFADAVPSTALTQGADGPRLEIAGLPGLGVSLLGLAVLTAALVGLLVGLRGPAHRTVRWMLAVSLVLLVLALGSLAAQVVGVTGLGSHQVRWLFAMAPIVHVSIAWGAFDLWRARPIGEGQTRADHPRGCGVAVPAAVVLLLTVANLGFHAHDLGPTADRRVADILRPVFADLGGFHPDQPVVYDVDSLTVFEPYSAAVLMRLDELGVEFRIDHDGGHIRQYGGSRRADGTEPVRLRQLVGDAALTGVGAACVVSRHSALLPADAREADALIAAAAADLAGGRAAVDPAGLPAEAVDLARAAAAGDVAAAIRLVARGWLPELVGEGRIGAPTPAIEAAVAAREVLRRHVDTMLAITAEPAGACSPG
jgi:hypothetical protein